MAVVLKVAKELAWQPARRRKKIEDEVKGTRTDCEEREESGSERARELAGMGKLDGFFPVGLPSCLPSFSLSAYAFGMPRLLLPPMMPRRS